MQEEKRKLEKEKALRDKAGVFGGGIKQKEEKKAVAVKAAVETPVADAPAAKKIDGRMGEMMRSE